MRPKIGRKNPMTINNVSVITFRILIFMITCQYTSRIMSQNSLSAKPTPTGQTHVHSSKSRACPLAKRQIYLRIVVADYREEKRKTHKEIGSMVGGDCIYFPGDLMILYLPATLSEPNVICRVGGYFYLRETAMKMNHAADNPKPNGSNYTDHAKRPKSP